MARIELSYTPQPRQALMHKSLANEILYGGQAGGGKSFSLRWDAYEFCLKNPGCVGVLVRQTLPQLEKNHIRHVRKELPKELASYNETRKQLTFWNGSVLTFQHLEYDKDINDFQGDEIHWLGIDEAALLKPEHIQEIKSRLRLGSWKPQDPEAALRLPRLVMTSNPGGPAHLYLKEGWIDPAPRETVFTRTVEVLGEKIDVTRVFIPAAMTDNSYLDKNYRAQFADMPEWKQRQFVEGDWNAIPGAYFDCWDSGKHVISPFALPRWWPIYRSVDWGFATPFAVLEWTVSDGTTVVQKSGQRVRYPDGALICIWEWYGEGQKRGEGLRMDGQQVAEIIVRARGKCKPGPGDPSMKRADSGPSVFERFRKGGMRLYPADNQREAGWQEMYRRIASGMLYVVEDCRNLIATLPTMVCDPMNPDDLLKCWTDHCVDSARYQCMARPMKNVEPVEPEPIDAPLRYVHLEEIPKREPRWI